jgi:hypothetical protein
MWKFWRQRPANPQVQEDADILMEWWGNSAYYEADKRADQARLRKVIDGNRPPNHWRHVRSEIARRIGRVEGLDTATRYYLDRS